MSYKASAPGSAMLLGEYAVLDGKPSVVCALNKRITVELQPRRDENIYIHSDTLGDYNTTLSTLHIAQPFQFVLGTLKHFQKKMRYGCDINIMADFSDQVGFGSSAAVTVATLAAIVTWLGIRMQPHDVIRQGRMIIREVQGSGSGADIAASVMGGIVAYQAKPMSAEKFDFTFPITMAYSGFKTKTPVAIQKVRERFEAYPQLYAQLSNAIGQCAVDGIYALRKQDETKFATVLNTHQGLHDALGVNLPVLQNIIYSLKAQPTIQAAKISGSGLGDCVVALGEISHNVDLPGKEAGVQLLDVAMTTEGVQCEKI